MKIMKREVHALYIASRDPRTPYLTKVLAFFILAYALSPIDLIPDFIPVLGFLDDFLFVSVGIYFSIKFIPKPLWEEFQRKAAQTEVVFSENRIAAGFVILIWIVGIVLAGFELWQLIH